MTETSPREASPSPWRWPPSPEFIAKARHRTRSALAGAVSGDAIDTVELLVGELATNAVVHAHTDFEVQVWARNGRVRAEVTDERPDRGLVAHDHQPYAATGRGLALVEELTAAHGVQYATGHKTVWFELWPEETAPPASVWEIAVPNGPMANVTLIDVPYSLYTAAQQQWEGMLRELSLAIGTEDKTGVRPLDLAVAQAASDMIYACMTAGVQQETMDSSTVSLLVAVPTDAAEQVSALRRTLDVADVAAQRGSLLALPALPQIRAFRRWLFDQIAEQLTGGDPLAWTLGHYPPSAAPTELAPWDASSVQSAAVPTVAADEGNRIIAVNSAAEELLGWGVGELVGQRLTVIIPEHLRARHEEAFTSLLLTGEARILGRSIPVPALHRDGRLVPIRLYIQTQESVDGHTVFVAQLTARTAPPGESADESLMDAALADVPEPSAAEAARTASRTAAGGARPPGGASAIGLVGTVGPAGPVTTRDRAAEQHPSSVRLALFADAGAALASTLDLDERLQRVGEVLTERLADWCVIDLRGEHDELNRMCVVHRDPKVSTSRVRLGALPPVDAAAHGALPRALRGAGPLLLRDFPPSAEAGSEIDARQLELFEQLGADTAIVAPLRAHREIVGALTMARTSSEDPFVDEDVLLVAEFVRRISPGLYSARMHQNARYTAENLQRALLPELPHVEHLELAARYAPSSAEAEIGGDWYDAFVLPDGDTGLVIGDVSGHDLQAAVAMSELRNTLRAIAVDRRQLPGAVLGRMDLTSHSLYPDALATCVYGLLKANPSGDWELDYSSAGHLPPLLTTREGQTRFLESGTGVLLGVRPDSPRSTAHDSLPPHATLLLYTDGLIERRGEPIDQAMTRLRRHTAQLADAPLDVFCDELIRELAADSTDDIAMLAVRPGTWSDN